MIISTKRLWLRELTIDDAIHFYNINNDPECIAYTGDGPFESLDASKAFMLNYLEQYEVNRMGRWAVCLKGNDTFVGWCGLKYHEKEKVVDVGYRFYKAHWNKGYATEATKACLEVGFDVLGLERIVAHAHIENHASHRVLLKSGLKCLKEIVHDGQPALLYEINKNDYLGNT